MGMLKLLSVQHGNHSTFLTHHRKRIAVLFGLLCFCMAGLTGRLVFLMMYRADHYSEMAEDLHQRERSIKAARGRILDANKTVIADNRTVCTVSVIHNQVEDPKQVIHSLCNALGMEEAPVRKKVEKRSSREIIRTNVDKETGDQIREMHLAGVKVDEDYKRYYPFDSLASKVLGFTGGDNQGIIGLESVYDKYLEGTDGLILTTTDARGVEVDNIGEERKEPVAGNNLRTSLDANIQMFAMQAANKAYIQKEADSVSIIVMNPSNGAVMAMVDYPEFHLNEPFQLIEEYKEYEGTKKEQEYCNRMWRNQCINDTYEPGSTFKVITAAAALEEGVVSLEDRFHCPGYIVVEDRRIRCHKTTGHGAESFVEGIENSCNPVFINVGLRIGADHFYDYFEQFGLLHKTGIDLPGEASTIMHKREKIGLVELATISFGQSFQITPIQLATTVSSIINGGNRVTPHIGMQVENGDKKVIKTFDFPVQEGICREETSEKMRFLLEKVVSEGGGNKAYIEGYEIGGKTATSQTLPRSAHKYISSFLGFAPADDPKVLVLVIIRNPSGIYYGGTIAAPVAKEIFENILPYLELEQ